MEDACQYFKKRRKKTKQQRMSYFGSMKEMMLPIIPPSQKI